jgi:hypothetical protein
METAKKNYPLFHVMNNYSSARMAACLIGASILIIDLTIDRPAVAAPYSWTMK